MKKILTLGALAFCFAVTEQSASAWINSKFGIGLNWNWQSGGNNFIWGLFRNGQPPGPCCDPFMGGCPGGPGFMPGGPGFGPGGPACPGYGAGFPAFPPAGAIYGPQEFQYFGRHPAQQPGGGDLSQQQQQTAPTNFRTAAYYPYQAVQYYPANGNTYWSPYAYGYTVGR